jgi:hypothetical protein
MTRTRIVLGSTILLLVLGLVLVACGSAQEAPASGGEVDTELDGKALVEERCTECHNLQTVTSARKSREGWQSNVERMIGKGARLNDAEKAVVIDYLAETYPE